jgi:hypothetical protein
MDEIRRAYAILGLPNGAPASAVRTRYRALVRQWHPDRYAGDPVAVAEATAHLRVVNDAYETLKARPEPKPMATEPFAAPATAPAPAGRRLSREEIDGMIDSVRSIRGDRSARPNDADPDARRSFWWVHLKYLLIGLFIVAAVTLLDRRIMDLISGVLYLLYLLGLAVSVTAGMISDRAVRRKGSSPSADDGPAIPTGGHS